MISQIVTKWQPFFKIQDGGDRPVEFLQICIFDNIDTFQIEVPMFQLILVTIVRILKKWQQLLEIQDGGSRHLEKYTSGRTIIMRNEFLVYNFQSKM